jgi:HD-GYP domain-containing protein (c-di-GMP phosphodiesterase class II)
MVLGRTIYSGLNAVLLASGQTIDDRYITLLHKHGFGYIYVEEDGFEEVNPQDVLSDVSRRIAEATIRDSFDQLRDAVRLESESAKITREFLETHADILNVPQVDEMAMAVSTIIRDIVNRSVGLVDVFAQVTQSTYMYRHAVNVVSLSVLLARQFGYTNRQLRELGLAALLHEVGKICLGDDMLLPEHMISEDDADLYREYPVYGFILMHSTNPAMKAERLAILHHREWQDGGGWPQGLRGDNQPPTRVENQENGLVHRYAEIVSVASAYDNLVNGTGELPQRLQPADALALIMALSRKCFNQAVCQVFSRIVCLYPTGAMVQIQESSSFGFEGYYGVVKDQSHDPARPVLILYADPSGRRVRPKTLDFSHDPDLRLRIMA